jgi:hypothetical protein
MRGKKGVGEKMERKKRVGENMKEDERKKEVGV